MKLRLKYSTINNAFGSGTPRILGKLFTKNKVTE